MHTTKKEMRTLNTAAQFKKSQKNATATTWIFKLKKYNNRSSVVKQLCNHIPTRKLSYRKDDRAMRPIYGYPENFRESHEYADGYFSRNF